MEKGQDRFAIIGFIIIMIIILLVTSYFTTQNNKKRGEWINNVTVEFSGKIIDKRNITRGGRQRTIVCIKVDYSNTDSIVLQSDDQYEYLKISNKIATMVIPPEYYEIDSIALNVNNNRTVEYYKDGALVIDYPLSLNCAYVTEEDLKNSCQ